MSYFFMEVGLQVNRQELDEALVLTSALDTLRNVVGQELVESITGSIDWSQASPTTIEAKLGRLGIGRFSKPSFELDIIGTDQDELAAFIFLPDVAEDGADALSKTTSFRNIVRASGGIGLRPYTDEFHPFFGVRLDEDLIVGMLAVDVDNAGLVEQPRLLDVDMPGIFRGANFVGMRTAFEQFGSRNK